MSSTFSISTIVRGALLVLFLLAIFRIAALFQPYVVMTSAAVWPGLEFWRLLTYPLALNFGGLLVGTIAFSQPGEEIEGMLGKRSFGLLLLSVTLLASLLYLLIFWGRTIPALAGPQNIALFVMVGYVYLFPDSSVRIIFFDVRSKILLLLMSLLSLGIGVFWITTGETPLVLLGEGGLGLLAGAIWFHVVYQKYPVLLGPVRAVARLFERKPQAQMSVRSAPQTEQRSGVKKEGSRQGPVIPDDERLDMILEKISSSGYESLSGEERKFLEEYSSRL